MNHIQHAYTTLNKHYVGYIYNKGFTRSCTVFRNTFRITFFVCITYSYILCTFIIMVGRSRYSEECDSECIPENSERTCKSFIINCT